MEDGIFATWKHNIVSSFGLIVSQMKLCNCNQICNPLFLKIWLNDDIGLLHKSAMMVVGINKWLIAIFGSGEACHCNSLITHLSVFLSEKSVSRYQFAKLKHLSVCLAKSSKLKNCVKSTIFQDMTIQIDPNVTGYLKLPGEVRSVCLV